MIFNPRRGGSAKEYTITVGTGVTSSATNLKPGHVFRANTNRQDRKPQITFVNPNTENTVTIQGIKKISYFVMPCADVTLSYY